MKKLLSLLPVFVLVCCTQKDAPPQNIHSTGDLSFENNTLHVSKSGGTYNVKILGNVPFKNVTIPASGTMTGKPDIYTKITLVDKKFTSNEMTLKVAASSGTVMADTTIIITTNDGADTAKITITQDGDPALANTDEKLKNYSIITMAKAAEALDLLYTTEAVYTKNGNLNWAAEFYNKPVSPKSEIIKNMWDKCYKAILSTNFIINEPGVPDAVKASYTTLRSILYYEMVAYWKNIPFVTNNAQAYPEQMPYEQILQQTAQQLAQAKTFLSNQKIDNGWINSADVPAQFLAKILMQQKSYSSALQELNSIINSNKYTLLSATDATFKKANTELIQGVYLPESNSITPYTVLFKQLYPTAELFPVAKFTETILLAAECYLQINDKDKAVEALNKLEVARGRTAKYTASTITIGDLQSIWKNECNGSFSYFDFLKRNNLAENVLNIPAYQALLPIPYDQIVSNPKFLSTPGYIYN